MKKSRRVEHNGKYCPACSENAIMPALPKCEKQQKIDKIAKSLGLDPDTIEGDYAEAYQHHKQRWDQATIDNRLDCNQKGDS